MNDARRVTVCIPTYCRPDYLAIALESVVNQDHTNVVISIGDDSPDDRSEAVVRDFRTRSGREIVYERHQPSLGQNANVDRLLKTASGDFVILLHDDDALAEGAISAMLAPFETNPELSIVFGKQQIIDVNGKFLDENTRKLNAAFRRTSDRAGIQRSALESALRQQLPNNGFLVRRELAATTGYGSYEDIGVFCDIDFGIRLTEKLQPRSVSYLDQFTSLYRLSTDGVSRISSWKQAEHGRSALILFDRIMALPDVAEIREARKAVLVRESRKIFQALALKGQRRAALRFFFSTYYPFAKRINPQGIYHLTLLISPKMAKIRRFVPNSILGMP